MNFRGFRPLYMDMKNRFLLATLCSCLIAVNALAQSPFDGTWKINLAESEKVAVKYKEGSGTGRSKLGQNVNVSIGGLPLPSSSRIPSRSGMAPKNPAVLLCTTMDIVTGKQRIDLIYDGDAKETLRAGDYRGRTSKWNRKLIQQKYKTPDRKVTKSWSIRPDGRLLVEVKLNPPRDKSRTYKRVFDRVETPPITPVSP